MAEKWMQKAFANAHGQFKAKAKKAGMSTAGYASKVTKGSSTASTKTKRQANLAKLGMKYGGGHAKQPHPKTNPGFYDTEPHAPSNKKATRPSLPSPALGRAVPPTVPQHPGRISGLGGPAHVMSRAPKGAHGFGHSVINRLGAIRLSGHTGAHRIGKR